MDVRKQNEIHHQLSDMGNYKSSKLFFFKKNNFKLKLNFNF